jgi:SET domain
MADRLSESDDRFTVGPSTIPGAGRGLFARVALAAGDRLEVIGVCVPAGSVSDDCTRYADEHKFRVGDDLLIPVGLAGMVNHSATPNLEKVSDGDRLFLRAVRDIAAEEELFFRYSEYAQQRFGLGEGQQS